MTLREDHRSVVLAVTHEISARTFYRGYLGYLKSKGWQVTIAAASDGGLECFAQNEGVSSHSVSMQRDPAPFRDILSLFKWIIYFRKTRPSVVVAATPKASLLALIAARITGVPVRTHQLWGLRFETERGIRRRVLRMLERVTISAANQVVCNSESLAKAVRIEGILGTAEPLVLGSGSSHGVDLEWFSREADLPILSKECGEFLESYKNATVVGFVGRLQQDKGIDVLLEALEIIRLTSDQEVACILVGGTEDQNIEQTIVQASERLNLFLAGTTDDPRPYLEAFDFLCLPTRREGFPNVVLEAASMSIPTITTNATGAIDSVVDGVTGVIVEKDCASSLADAILRLAKSPESTLAMGSAARAHVENSYSRERVWALQEQQLRDSLRGIGHDYPYRDSK